MITLVVIILGILLIVLICNYPIVGIVISVGIVLLTFIGWILENFVDKPNKKNKNVYNSLPYTEEDDYDDFLTYSDSYLEDWNNWN